MDDIDMDRRHRVQRAAKGEARGGTAFPRDDIEERIRLLRRRYLKRQPLFDPEDRNTAYERGEQQI